MVFVVLVAFVICWTPFQALVLVYSLNHNAAIHGAVSIEVYLLFLIACIIKRQKRNETDYIFFYT